MYICSLTAQFYSMYERFTVYIHMYIISQHIAPGSQNTRPVNIHLHTDSHNLSHRSNVCSAFMKRRCRRTRGCSRTNVACPTADATRHHLSWRMESRMVPHLRPCSATPSNSPAATIPMRVWPCTMLDYSRVLKSALCFGRSRTRKAPTGRLPNCSTKLTVRVTAIFISGGQ